MDNFSCRLVFISGVSTSGKTTIGKAFVENRKKLGEEWTFKDLDEFYYDKKPTIQLSNGKVKENWDCFEALDYAKLNTWLDYATRSKTNVCLVGFALSQDQLKLYPDIHFHLTLTSIDCVNSTFIVDDKKLAHLVAQNRQLTKGFKGDKAQDDVLMVKESLIPFYKSMVKELDSSTIFIQVTNSKNERIKMKEIINSLNYVLKIE